MFYEEVQFRRLGSPNGMVPASLAKALLVASEHDGGKGIGHMKMDQAYRVALPFINHPCDQEPSPARLC